MMKKQDAGVDEEMRMLQERQKMLSEKMTAMDDRAVKRWCQNSRGLDRRGEEKHIRTDGKTS